MRALAGMLAVAAVVPVVIGSFLGAFSFAVAMAWPDPDVPDGDPCCWHPDTWWEVARGTAFGAWTMMAAAAVGYLAWRLARFAGTGAPLDGDARARAVAAGAVIALWLVAALVAAS
jgi:hypothetical protein